MPGSSRSCPKPSRSPFLADVSLKPKPHGWFLKRISYSLFPPGTTAPGPHPSLRLGLVDKKCAMCLISQPHPQGSETDARPSHHLDWHRQGFGLREVKTELEPVCPAERRCQNFYLHPAHPPVLRATFRKKNIVPRFLFGATSSLFCFDQTLHLVATFCYRIKSGPVPSGLCTGELDTTRAFISLGLAFAEDGGL